MFRIALLPVFLALASLGATASVGFSEDDQSASCGGGESVMVCTEPACYLSMDGIAGCTGQTDAFTGSCSDNSILPAGSPGATVTEGICGSATVVLNKCHEAVPVCVDFFNQAGDRWRITCPGGTRTDVPCDTPVEGTCADVGLGNC